MFQRVVSVRRNSVPILGAGVLLGIAAMVAFQSNAEPWVETFDGAPASPQAWAPPDWDIQYHNRGSSYWAAPEGMAQQHGGDCSGPPNTHPASTWPGTVYQCANHVMTAINATEYGVIYLTPNRMADWSSGPAVIEFDMSTEGRSGRDWPDLIVSPWEYNQATPLISQLSSGVDLQGPPRYAVHVGMDTGSGHAPQLGITREGSNQTYDETWAIPSIRSGIAPGTNEAAVRQTFRLTLTSTSARFERLESPTASALLFWEHTFAAIPFTQGVVQFGHHSYTPWKDGNGGPQTWHWDNVSINPSVPFTMLKGDRRIVQNESQVVTFPSPAPAGAMLRFSSTHTPQVSVDGGPFVNATRQWEATDVAEHMSSYWHPVPEGTQSIRIRHTARSWYGLGWPPIAKDFGIWALGGAPSNTATPVPTSTSTPLPTSTPTQTVPPTATATVPPTSTPEPTATPIPPTNTPTSPTVAPTATATPTAIPCRPSSLFGWLWYWMTGECRR